MSTQGCACRCAISRGATVDIGMGTPSAKTHEIKLFEFTGYERESRFLGYAPQIQWMPGILWGVFYAF